MTLQIMKKFKLPLLLLFVFLFSEAFSFDNIKGYYLDREDTFISTMGFYKKIDYKIDYENKKIYVNGKTPSIIHQYDRDNYLLNTLDNWYKN